MTSPSWDFSFAESGMMMPPRACSPSSMRFTIMRSCNGWTFVVILFNLLLVSTRSWAASCELVRHYRCVNKRAINNKLIAQVYTLNFLVVSCKFQTNLAGPEELRMELAGLGSI